MKALLIHNNYRSTAPSGEDSVVYNEHTLLAEHGVDVITYKKFNDDIDDSSFLKRVRLGLNYAWSRRTYDEVSQLIKLTRPEIAHIHSVHPQISPSVYAACQDMRVPVVHTLHNYRYICPGALLLRNGQPCEECLGHLPFKALRYRCYRDSLAATGSLFWMITYNRLRGTFANQVNRYIALTEFAASRLAAGGLPFNRIEVKPNFLPIVPSAITERENYAVYVGRLTEEKGVNTLIKAWQFVSNLPLKIIGDGALRSKLEMSARESKVDVEFLGTQTKKKVLSIIGSALLQIVPSECYEGFPMVILEAYACATPVIASRIGSIIEVVRDGDTGLHFEAGNAVDLALKVNELKVNPDLAFRLGMSAREIFLERYTPEQNFKLLMEIYRRAQNDFEVRRKR
jgi:glycosyltransferase involved in cell wall biosynthesis